MPRHTIRLVISFPPVPEGDPIRVSASSYVTYRRCPAAAEARFRGIYPPESQNSFTGALAHRLIARHLNNGPVEDVAQACREEIGAAMNGKLGALGLRPSQLAGVISEVGALYERFRRYPLDGFVGAEVSIEVEPMPGVSLIGKIDAVFSGAGQRPLLRDWKSGGLGEPADQLAFYALLWAVDKQAIPSAVEAVSLQTGERFRTDPGIAELEIVAGSISALVTDLRRGWATGVQPLRVGGPWCAFCPLLDDCPEGRAASVITRPGG
jgi:hypothetical protein